MRRVRIIGPQHAVRETPRQLLLHNVGARHGKVAGGSSGSRLASRKRRPRAVVVGGLAAATVLTSLFVSGAFSLRVAAASYSATIIGDGPSAYYRLDESACCTATDSSGHGRNGTYTSSGVTFGASGALSSDSDTAAAFDGSSGWVSIPTSDTIAGSFSVEAWVKPSSIGGDLGILGTRGPQDYGFDMQIYQGKVHGDIGTGSSWLNFNADASLTVQAGAWYHIVYVVAPGVWAIYVNGSSAASGTLPAGTPLLWDSNHQLEIANVGNPSTPFNGSVDEVAVYPTALTASQVASHFAASGDSAPTAPTNLTGTPGTNSVTLSWIASTAGVPAGQPAVQSYTVTAYKGAIYAGYMSVAGSSTSATMSGLAGGASYTFQVYGSNVFGNSAASSVAVTPNGTASDYGSTVLADNPLIFYQFNEASGTSVGDSSGNGRTGTYGTGTGFGAPGALIGSTDTAIQAPGSGAWAITQSGSTLPTGGADRTYELWSRISSSYNHTLVATGDGSNHLFNINLTNHNQVVLYGDGNTSAGINTPNAYDDNVWHLIDVAVSSGTEYVYLDGQQIGSTSLTINTAGGYPLDISNGGGIYPGGEALDEFAAYGTRLSTARIEAHWSAGRGQAASGCAPRPTSPYATAVLGDSPLTYLRLDDAGAGHGNLVLDSAATSACHPGVFDSGVVSMSGALVSESNAAMQAPASGYWAVNQGGDNLPLGAADRTYEIWIKTQSDYNHTLMQTGDQSNHRFDIGVHSSSNSSTIDLYGDANSVVSLGLHAKYSDGYWHMLDVSLHVGTASVYVDGQLVGSLSVTLNTTQGSGLQLTNGGGIYPGGEAVDEFAAYGTALSASQIDNHWVHASSHLSNVCQSAPTTGYPAAVMADHPVNYYPLTDIASDPATRIAADLSGSGCQDGALDPAAVATPSSPTVSGVGGSLVSPTNGNATLTTSGSNLPTGTAARSFEFWFRTKSDNLQTLLLSGDQSNHRFNVHLRSSFNTSYVGIDADAGSSAEIALPSKYSDGSWHMLDVTFAGGSAGVYYDGLAAGSLSATVNTVNSNGVMFGRGGGVDNGGESVGQFSAYNSALTPTQVLVHYLAAVPTGGPYGGRQTDGGGNFCLACLTKYVQAMFGSPVNSATGNMWDTSVDLSISGRSYPLAFIRTYNSDLASLDGPLGYGWQPNYMMSLAQSGNTATITQENGSQATFTQSGSTWSPSAPRFIATLTHNGDGTWTFVRQARDTFAFSASGLLLSETDLNGYTTTFGYSSGQLTSVTDPAGRSLTIGWTGSHIISVTDSNVSPARSVHFQYNDASGNLTDVTDVNGGHWHYVYDASHRLTSMLDPNCYAAGSQCNGGSGVLTHYNGQGRVDWQQDQLGRQTSFDYTSIVGATKVTDPAGHIEVDYYTQGLLVAKTRGYGTGAAATTYYGYDPNTLARTTVVDGDGHATQSSVDASGNPLTSTDSLGRTTTRTYNSLNEPLTGTDGNGVATTYAYDARGNVTSVSRPLVGTSQVQTTLFNHADSSHPGDVTSMVDPDAKTWTYGYDANGYRSSVRDPLGNTATSTFNADGWLLATVSPKGNVSGCGCTSAYTTVYSYTVPGSGVVDEFGDVQTVTDPLGHVTTVGYDADRNRTSAKDADGHLTTYVFDLANELIQTKRADTPQTTVTTDYNPDGTASDQKDGKGNALQTYGYDALGRVTTVTDALGNATTYALDGAGNRLTKQDPVGNCSASPMTGCTVMAYDAANEFKAVTYSDGATPNVSGISYDADGQRIAETDGTGTSSWTWDSLHRLTSYTNGNGKTVSYTYNLRSLVTTIGYPGGGKTVSRGYDDAGRWTTVTDWQSPSNTSTFGYDVNGNMTSTSVPGGVIDATSFNAADQLTSISDVIGSSSLFAATYGRDNNGWVSSDSSAPGANGSYRYTALNQLCYAGASNSAACSAPPSGAFAYRFDIADNLIQTENTTQTGAVTQAFNADDQICWTVAGSSTAGCSSPPSGVITYSYDSRGNRTAAGSTSYAYDQANRLTSYAGGTAIYAYDGAGLRTSKTIAGATTQFAWDGSGSLPLLLEETTGAGTTDYIYGPGSTPIEQINPAPAAITSVGAATTASDANGTAGSLTLTLPSSIQSGDQIVVATTYPAGINNSAGTPSGYAQIGPAAKSGGTSATADVTQVFHRTATTADTTVTISYSGVFPKAAVATVYRGVDSLPIDVSALGSTARGTNVSASTTTRYPADELVLIQGATYSATGTGSWGAPSGMVEQSQKDATTINVGLADAPQSAAAATGSLTSTFTPSGLTLSGPQLTNILVGLRTPPRVVSSHVDQLGSIRLLTDAAGQVAATRTYDPYGNAVAGASSSPQQVVDPFGFAGQYRDSESGTYYLRARYYDPETGQFLSRDPLAALTLSPYRFVAGNPINATDPSGLRADYIDIGNPVGEAAAVVAAAVAGAIALWSWLSLDISIDHRAQPPWEFVHPTPSLSESPVLMASIASDIANGHAWSDEPARWEGICADQEELASKIEEAIQNGQYKKLPREREAWYDEDTGIIVVHDPTNEDQGTALPDKTQKDFDTLK
jgi:RHS repeat-associated protein